ncbi:MAG: hypothetical protein ACK6BC_14165 [Cyanobacteriota bacterium]
MRHPGVEHLRSVLQDTKQLRQQGQHFGDLRIEIPAAEKQEAPIR